MKEATSRSENAVVNYGQWVLRWRWVIILASLAISGFLASGAQNLWLNTNYRAFFSEDNPQLLSFEALQDIYTKNDNILFVLEPKNGEVFTRENLAVLEDLTRQAWQIPYTIRVDAVSNFQHTRAEGDELIVEDLVEGALDMTPEQAAAAKGIALAELNLYKRLISAKTHVTGVNVTLQLPGNEFTEIPEAVTFARNTAQQLEAQHPGLAVHLTGTVMLNNAFSEAATEDMQTLVPLMYAGMFAVMILLLRSLSSTLATLAVVTLSSVVAMGLAGWFRIGLTPPSAQAPTMIMTLAIADSIHILVTMLREMRHGRPKRDAIVESLRINMQPVFLTSLTTAIGFLSMNFSDAPPFHHLGNTTAAGVMAAFIFSVLFLPALMAVLPVRIKRQAEKTTARFDRFASFVIGRRQPLLWGSGLAVLLVSIFITKNELNDQFVGYFDERIEFRRDTDFAVENLSGIYQVEFSIGAGQSGAISDPAYLHKLEEFAAWYRTRPEVVHVNSFSEVMKRLNKNMHGDDPAFYRLRDQRDLAAQYLLLYEMSLPYGLDLNNQINVDKSATRFVVTLDDISSLQLRQIATAGEDWLKTNAPPHMQTNGASAAVMFAYISGRNIESMLWGTTAALVIISLALMVVLRSVKFGLLSLVPNLFPAAAAFGIWGLLVGQINMGLSIVTGMTLGIVVDDTVHFLTKYLRARRENDLTPSEAVRYAFSSVGLALVATSLILTIGFGVLSLSSFEMNAGMGQLTAITIVLALAIDFFFLPPLLMKVEGRREREMKKSKIAAALAATGG
jgi:predicted RND superfamily exporter protein